jgi:hypothetical protein
VCTISFEATGLRQPAWCALAHLFGDHNIRPNHRSPDNSQGEV